MTERPILFSGPMVRAILAGQKTQTRRAVAVDLIVPDHGYRMGDALRKHRTGKPTFCPYGHAGDRLWVREAWLLDRYDASTQYRASHPAPSLPKWKPSIHMPRELCRLLLDVTAVRIERLQDCSEADARAEGIDAPTAGSHRAGYALLWDSLNAKRGFGWSTNPWVWVIEFRRGK